MFFGVSSPYLFARTQAVVPKDAYNIQYRYQGGAWRPVSYQARPASSFWGGTSASSWLGRAIGTAGTAAAASWAWYTQVQPAYAVGGSLVPKNETQMAKSAALQALKDEYETLNTQRKLDELKNPAPISPMADSRGFYRSDRW